MPLYNGFSTINRQKRFKLSDFDLAKQDLFNHLHIRKGEKLMKPTFGTVIWDMLFEQLTEETKMVITSDLEAIISNDPRLLAESMIVDEYENGLMIRITLRYLPTNQVDTMRVMFDRSAVSAG